MSKISTDHLDETGIFYKLLTRVPQTKGVTMYIQLLCHLLGDYVLQSTWMANNKTKSWFAAFIHAFVYYLPFHFVLYPSPQAAIIIIATHAVIDRYRLAKYVAYAKNFLAPAPAWPSWANCHETGNPKETPPFLAVWLMIIVDNAMHLIINALALSFL